MLVVTILLVHVLFLFACSISLPVILGPVVFGLFVLVVVVLSISFPYYHSLKFPFLSSISFK